MGKPKFYRQFKSLRIAIDRPKGHKHTIKTYKGPLLYIYPYDYGYIPNTRDNDDSELDVFIGDSADSEKVFIVHKMLPDCTTFDEHKVFLGFDNKTEVMEIYKDYPKQVGMIEPMTFQEFIDDFLPTVRDE